MPIERAEERFNSVIFLAQATGDGEVDYLALEGHRHTEMIRHNLRFPTGANHRRTIPASARDARNPLG